jgi:hypothetical protein
MSKEDNLKIEELEDKKMFKVTQTIIDGEIEPEKLLKILGDVIENKANLEKQKEDAEKGLKFLSNRLEELNQHEQKARLWSKENELHDLRKSKPDNKPAEDQAQPGYT